MVSAALHDPRGGPLELADIDRLDVEIALLSPLEPIAADAIRPGVDGLVLEYRGRRGTLLPVVWAQLPEVAVFLAALKQKAGLSRDFVSPELKLSRYTTERYVDPAPGA
jgi:AMMECR1 domain-containing protein